MRLVVRLPLFEGLNIAGRGVLVVGGILLRVFDGIDLIGLRFHFFKFLFEGIAAWLKLCWASIFGRLVFILNHTI